MDAGAQTERNKSGSIGRLQPVHSPHRLYIGIDIGSTSSDVVVQDSAGSIITVSYTHLTLPTN